MESTECGTAKALFSLVRAAAVTCAIMNPEFNPGSGVRNAGSMLVNGFVICSIRLDDSAQRRNRDRHLVRRHRQRLPVKISAADDVAVVRVPHKNERIVRR